MYRYLNLHTCIQFLVDYSNCLPYSCIAFAVFKNTVTFPCIGDCECKRRHIHMFSPLLLSPLLPYSPTSWHLLRQEGLIIFPLHRLTHFITPPFFKTLHCCLCLQCLCTAAPPNITLLCLRGLCTDLINFSWNDSHKQHFKHQIYLKAKWSGEHSTTRASGNTVFFSLWLSHWLAIKTSSYWVPLCLSSVLRYVSLWTSCSQRQGLSFAPVICKMTGTVRPC